MSNLQNELVRTSWMNASDHLLLTRYSDARNPEVFLELVRRYAGLVYGTCLRITASVHGVKVCPFIVSRR